MLLLQPVKPWKTCRSTRQKPNYKRQWQEAEDKYQRFEEQVAKCIDNEALHDLVHPFPYREEAPRDAMTLDAFPDLIVPKKRRVDPAD